MKTFKFILAFVFLGLTGFSATAQSKIAIVDLKKLFDDYYKTKTADAAIKDKANDLDKERKNLMDQYEKVQGDYKKAVDGASDQAVSAEEREKRKKSADAKLLDLKDLEQTIGTFDRQSRTTLDEQMRRMRDNILAEIRNVVNTRAKAAGYSMVIDTAAQSINNTPIILFSNGENDITSSILSQLNAGAPPAPTTSPK